jgi:flagellar hook-associated protein 2
VQSFVKLYNSTVGAVQHQLSAKRSTHPESQAELETGTLYGDTELLSLLNEMRQSNYASQTGLPTEMSSLADIGVSTGAPSGTAATSQSTLEGQLQLNTATLESALASNPAGVEKMLHSWSSSFESLVNRAAAPGGALETRSESDTEEASQLTARITAMNEVIALHQKNLEQQFTAMEAAVSRNKSQLSWLEAHASSTASTSTSTATTA